MSAAASLGLSLLWDTDMGLSHVDKYTYSSEEHIKVIIYTYQYFHVDKYPYSRLEHSSQLVSSAQVCGLTPTPPWPFSVNTPTTNPFH